jgi:hypothetical protein
MTPELAEEIKRFPAVIGEDRIFQPKRGAKGERQASSLRDVIPRQLGVSLGHLNVGVSEDLCEFVEVAAVHHEPRSERGPQIMKTEAPNAGQIQDRFETPLAPSLQTGQNQPVRQ